ncbi:MAG TPA: DUF4302 domain-containing protein [Ohtaekwangia sp.]
MKKLIYSLLFLVLIACQDNDTNEFDKSADERVAEAIANLKADLTAPDNGWKLKYRPVDGSGSYYVFLKFEDDRTVNIRTDLGAEDGKYFDQTLTYRIDNSLGLELIIENYSFFAYLFELDDATFEAEFEFLYANKTPSGELVFTSKSDTFIPVTTLVFEEAEAGEDDAFLGTEVSENLNIMADDFDNFSPSMKLTYADRNIELYLAMDDVKRTIDITRAVRKSNPAVFESLDFSSPYIIRGDSIVLDNLFSGTFVGVNVSIQSIRLTTLTESEITICTDPMTVHAYEGTTSANDDVVLESTLFDLNGRSFATLSDFYISPLGYIFNNGQSAAEAIANDIHGALAMQMYYNYDGGFYAIGFIIQNDNGTITFALREFTPVLTGNNLVFNFAPDISIFGEPDTDADIENVNIYLEALTEGDNTYVFELDEGLYEFFNPCTGWSFVFYDAYQ